MYLNLFYLFLFSLSLGQLVRIGIFDMVVVNISDILLLLSVVFWMFQKKKVTIQKSFLFTPLILLMTACILSLLVNIFTFELREIGVSSLYLIRWALYVCVYFIVISFGEKEKQTIRSLMHVVGCLWIGIGYFQYFFYSSLRNLYYLGWDEHLYRMFGSFLDPNFAGALFTLYFLFALGDFITEFRKNKRNDIIRIFILLATFGAVLLTFSRSSLLMLVISSMIFLLLLGFKKYIFVPVIGILLFALVVSPFFAIENLNLFRIASSTARLETMNNAITVIQDFLFFGVGFNTYRYAQERYGFISTNSLIPNHAASGVDNSLLFVWATTGIFGLGAYIYLWFRITKKAYGFISTQNKIHGVIILSSVGGLLVHSMFINSLFYAPIVIWMWLVIGLESE